MKCGQKRFNLVARCSVIAEIWSPVNLTGTRGCRSNQLSLLWPWQPRDHVLNLGMKSNHRLGFSLKDYHLFHTHIYNRLFLSLSLTHLSPFLSFTLPLFFFYPSPFASLCCSFPFLILESLLCSCSRPVMHPCSHYFIPGWPLGWKHTSMLPVLSQGYQFQNQRQTFPRGDPEVVR